MSWEAQVIDELCELKLSGVDFDRAWRVALRRHPPTVAQLGYRETLFVLERGADGEVSDVEWLQWAASEAWHGERPVLSHLRSVGLTESRDRLVA